jgi:aryl-alcohol dehydrogenase-like predicted oxidoreductase
MGMSFVYGPADEEESLRVLHRYLELGGNFLDTAEIYGPYKNEELLGRFLRQVPRKGIVVATKFGFRISADGMRTTDSSPASVRRACDASRASQDRAIDLYYQHRVDRTFPSKKRLRWPNISAGKVRSACQSRLRNAATGGESPSIALQSEYSL